MNKTAFKKLIKIIFWMALAVIALWIYEGFYGFFNKNGDGQWLFAPVFLGGFMAIKQLLPGKEEMDPR